MRFKLPEIPPPKLVTTLRSYNLLPAIVFLPTRRKCDEAALEVAADKSQKIDAEKQNARFKIYNEFLVEYPEIKSHKHRKIMLRGGVASHHAGHIPAWKLLIEKMMSKGLLNTIFATSTVAAGVDFPARTVVITNADTRGNDGWRPLQASELQQMTGRAGRRGKDNVGFVVLAPGQFQNPPKIAELLKSPPDALQSRFRATYSSLLNLLDAYGNFAQVREIAEKSFAFLETARQIAKLEKKRERRLRELSKKLEGNEFDLTVNAARRARQYLRETYTDAEFIEKTERDIEILRSEIWLPFERRAQVLNHFGYLDFPAQKVTPRGKWLADLRVDRPLLVGEALRHGLFEKLETKHIAALMASLAADSDRNYGELRLSDKILDVLTEFEDIVYEVSNAEWKFGVEPAPELNLSASAAAERWTDGMSWNDLVSQTKAEEGDLVRLLSRTGEALLQVAQLKNSNPQAAEIARTTAEIILREPIR